MLEQVLALPTAERAAFLDTACAADDGLRREVEQLLATQQDASAFFSSLADDVLPAELRRPAELVEAFSVAYVSSFIGRMIGQYRILSKLGGGGMGVVYRAEDTRLRRMVALKFLPPNWSGDAAAKQRFLHEARIASALDHPNICTIYEIGETPEGQLFIAMACYAGETLGRKIARGPLRVPEAVDLGIQVAQGLTYAHNHGIVHRDVKPANVMVTESGVVKLLDFGLAKVADVRLTRTGVMLGTVAYMSPEQVEGGRVDARTDIWSLGVVLYEMLTGQRPFRGEVDHAVMSAIRYTDPPPVSGFQRDISSRLAAAVHRALEKDPEARYGQMEDLLADLEAAAQQGERRSLPAPDLRSLPPSPPPSAPAAPPAAFARQTALLPPAASPGPASTATGSRAAGADSAGGRAPASLKVLVVDDEPDLELLVRYRFRHRIRRGEVNFVFAGNGQEALAKLEADPGIEVVLTDILMPRMDGLTLLGRIGAMDRLLKVVIVSAYGDMENIRTAMNRGAFDFLTKPIDFSDLEATLEKAHRELALLRQSAAARQELGALQRDLEIAGQLQLAQFSRRFPAFPERDEFDVHAVMIPAHEVGGAFYDFFLIDEHRLGFLLGDVQGRGISAALFLAIARGMLRATALQGAAVEACLTHVNRVLYPEAVPQMGITLVYGILDTRTGAVSYCNAGHPPPYRLSGTGAVDLLDDAGDPGLCLQERASYRSRTVVLQPGDGVLLYNEGVRRALSPPMHGQPGDLLAGCLQRVAREVPAEQIRHVLRAASEEADGEDQPDDLTLLALQFRRPSL